MGDGRLVGFLALCLCSTAYAQSKDAKACALKVEVALKKPTPAAAEGLLKQGYEECGDGHGFLSAMALAAAAQGDFERAVDLCLRELGKDEATARAVDVFLALYPRVSDVSRRKMFDLGTSPDAPLHLPQEGMALEKLVDQVYCKGSKLVAMPEAINPKAQSVRINVECPRGKVTPRYVRWATPATRTTAGARRAIDRLIEDGDLDGKFGVANPQELKQRMQEPLTADRSQAWLLSNLADGLRAKEVWALLVKKNPNDLEAIVDVAEYQRQLGQFDQALKTLRAADPTKVELLDTRGGTGSPSKLFSMQCRILLRQKKLAEATVACNRAIELGSTMNGPIALAEILYLQGKYDDALPHLDKALELDVRNQRGWLLAALINQQLGRTEEAKARFDGSYGLSVALNASLDDKRTGAQWMALVDEWEDRNTAYEFAECGHNYLDLELPKLSQACFAASEKINPFAAKVMRLEHQAETDPAAALKAADALLAKSRDARLLFVVARTHAHAGVPHDGIPALKEALYKIAPWELPDELVRTVCVDEPLAACMKLAP